MFLHVNNVEQKICIFYIICPLLLNSSLMVCLIFLSSNGFARCAFIPASIHFSASSLNAFAVIAMTGIVFASCRSRHVYRCNHHVPLQHDDFFKNVFTKNTSSFLDIITMRLHILRLFHTFQIFSGVVSLYLTPCPDRKKRKPYFYDLRLFTNFTGDLL